MEDVFVDKVKREKRDWVESAKDILKQADELGKKIITPVDLVVSDGVSAKTINIDTDEIPTGWMAFDVGPRTQEEFSKIISQSKTVFMNGPMGKFETPGFAKGSEALLDAMKSSKTNMGSEMIIAGGDTIDVARDHGSLEDYSHVSLAGGATLEFLAGKVLPALVPLTQK